MKWFPRHQNKTKKYGVLFPKKTEKHFVRGKKSEKNDEVQKKNRAEKRGCWIIVFLWVLFGGIAGYQTFLSGVFAVGRIDIESGGLLGSDEVRQNVEDRLSGYRLWVFPRDNMFLVSPRDIEDYIRESFPLVRQVEVKRTFPNTLTVSILERGALFFWCSGGDQCLLLDEKGMVLDRPQALDEHRVPQFFLVDELGKQASFGDQVVDPSILTFVRGLPQALSEQMGIQMKEKLFLPSKYADEIRIETENGFDIRMNTGMPLEKILNILRIVREKAVPHDQQENIASIDLRVPGRAFYRLQEGEQKDGEISLGETQTKK